jgi:hypothetical protein
LEVTARAGTANWKPLVWVTHGSCAAEETRGSAGRVDVMGKSGSEKRSKKSPSVREQRRGGRRMRWCRKQPSRARSSSVLLPWQTWPPERPPSVKRPPPEGPPIHQPRDLGTRRRSEGNGRGGRIKYKIGGWKQRRKEGGGDRRRARGKHPHRATFWRGGGSGRGDCRSHQLKGAVRRRRRQSSESNMPRPRPTPLPIRDQEQKEWRLKFVRLPQLLQQCREGRRRAEVK